MADQDIVKELEKMNAETNELEDEFIRLTWWMRGGISYYEIVNLPHSDREKISKLIKENQETSKKIGVPIF